MTTTNEDPIKGYGGGKAGAVIQGIVAWAGEECEGATILLAVHTNVDLLGLMREADAVVTVRGGPLSHAAIVCSEWGKPFVVGCGSELLNWVTTGMEVSVDVDAGIVSVL